MTGKVSDGDGDAGDGGESKVIEGVEIGDGFGEGRIAIYDWILRLSRCSNVCVHLFASFELSSQTSMAALFLSHTVTHTHTECSFSHG